MSHNCNCGCSSENANNSPELLQIKPRTEAVAAPTQTEIKVSGMTCGHCVASVTEELKEIAGVDSVDVVLDAQGISSVTVTSASALTEDSIRQAIDEAGYTVEAINA